MYYEKLVKEQNLNYDYEKEDKINEIIFKKLWKEYNDKYDELENKIQVIKWKISEENFKHNLFKIDNNHIADDLKKELSNLEEEQKKIEGLIVIMKNHKLYKKIKQDDEYSDCGKLL